MNDVSLHALGVHLSSLSKSFGTTTALESINLEITPGEFSILIGPSGCGKTTLLRILGRLDYPSSGTATYFDRHQNEIPADSISLSYGFQEPRLLPWRTVYNNVALPLQLKGMSETEIEPQVMDLIERVGLADARFKRPHELSGGMKMRAAIARSLVTQPQFLLLDEPFGALDEITKNRLDDELLKLWQKLDVTVVLVTHSLAEAVYLGQKVHILSSHPGRLSATLDVHLEDRHPQTRLSDEFAHYVAQAHRLLAHAEKAGTE
jgi:NitT/TauT family transport system ATP-binding protein